MFESNHGKVREICPKTGKHIKPKEVPKRLVVNHFLRSNNQPPGTLAAMRKKLLRGGLGSLTEKQIERVYRLIKKEKRSEKN